MAGQKAARGRVLVVDDEMHLRLFIQAVFDSAGYETATAKNGEEGLAKIRQWRPRLVSLDLMMPNQGGIRLLQQLRADAELAKTKVLVVSAIEGETFQHSLALLRAGAGDGAALAGPDGYVEKPPTAEVLLREAERILATDAADARPPGEHEPKEA